MTLPPVSEQEIKEYRQELEKVLKGHGYYLNPDDTYTNNLIHGILVNIKRYGYGCCPCRLAAKDKVKDIDVICPCYYRDDDVSEYGACFCGLYVSRENYKGKKEISSIPERRAKAKPMPRSIPMKELTITHTVWRCNVCGYLTARDTAPDVCPICGVPKDRFEIFIEGNK
ncbi:MAG: ferredoxin-thioredoxin reductase catalytic domain-containing protein [bacterium]|nr:ferredoxin-thioredoxin reductase catalytic domain-containing protein [bacterium]MDD5757325.1 ferredoxin-thioredoxin reductase catalytic domain-containing protein [bacterium]